MAYQYCGEAAAKIVISINGQYESWRKRNQWRLAENIQHRGCRENERKREKRRSKRRAQAYGSGEKRRLAERQAKGSAWRGASGKEAETWRRRRRQKLNDFRNHDDHGGIEENIIAVFMSDGKSLT